ncbi:MAG: hypothetical protein Q9180_006326 [Flavoplaca navasiana]
MIKMDCYTALTLLFCFIPLLVSSELMFSTATNTISLETGVPLARCDGFGLCEKDDGGVGFGETMEGHLHPRAIWIDSEELSLKSTEEPSGVEIGDIVVFDGVSISKLRSGILSTTTYRATKNLSRRYIWFNAGGQFPDLVGYLAVEPPVTDSGTVFESLVRDPLLAEIPTGLRAQVHPAMIIPPPTPGCKVDKCYQFIASADVFYFGPDPTDTACLSAITSSPPSPTPPPISMQWVASISPLTASFRSDTLSTLEYKTNAPPATKVMNYADLPCPPPAIAQHLNPELPYSPILKQLFRTYDKPANSTTCQMAAVIDPPVHAVRVDQISGPKDGGDTIA